MTSPYQPARPHPDFPQSRRPFGAGVLLPPRRSASRTSRANSFHPTVSGCRVTTQHDANVTLGVQQEAFSGLLQKELVRRRPPEASSSRVWRESNRGFGIRRSNEAVRLPSTNRCCGAVPCAPPPPHRRHPRQRQQPPEATPISTGCVPPRTSRARKPPDDRRRCSGLIGWLGERGLQQRRRHQRRQHDHGDDRRERGVAEDGRPGDEDRVADAGEDQTDLTVRNHADAN